MTKEMNTVKDFFNSLGNNKLEERSEAQLEEVIKQLTEAASELTKMLNALEEQKKTFEAQCNENNVEDLVVSSQINGMTVTSTNTINIVVIARRLIKQELKNRELSNRISALEAKQKKVKKE